MIILKINKLTDLFGRIDYKGLDIDKFICGSQLYAEKLEYCYVATTEEFTNLHEDITIVDEVEYSNFKKSLEEIMAKKTEIEQLKEQNIMLENAILDLANIVGGAK